MHAAHGAEPRFAIGKGCRGSGALVGRREAWKERTGDAGGRTASAMFLLGAQGTAEL